jgi:hypothetical protein
MTTRCVKQPKPKRNLFRLKVAWLLVFSSTATAFEHLVMALENLKLEQITWWCGSGLTIAIQHPEGNLYILYI